MQSPATSPTNLTTLRPLPNEDVFLFVKPFDNSHIVREADPGEGKMCWRAFAATIGTAALLIGLITPAAVRWIAGHQLETMRHQRDLLEKRRGELVKELAHLRSIPRLMAVAKEKGFVDPGQSKKDHLQPAVKGALAVNLQLLRNPTP